MDSVDIRLEAEMALLGGLLFDASLIESVAGLVDEADFYDPLNGRIYSIVSTRQALGGFTLPALTAELQAPLPDKEKPFIRDYIGRLAMGPPSTYSVPDYARTVRDFANKSRLHLVADWAAEKVGDLDYSAEKLTAEVEERLQKALHKGEDAATTLQLVSSGLDDWHEAVTDAWKADGPSGVQTGLTEYDKAINGLGRGALIIGAGRPGMGKTVFGLQAAKAAAKAGLGVYFVSLEMPRHQLITRLASDILRQTKRIPYSRIASGLLNQEEHALMDRARSIIDGLPLIIDDRTGLSAAGIKSGARRAARQFEAMGLELGLVVVDYLMLIRAPAKEAHNTVVAEGNKALAMKELAKDHNVPVLALSQLSRAVESRDSKRPVLSDLRYSGDIEAHADVVSFLYRPEYYHDKMDEADPAHEGHADWLEMSQKSRNKVEIITDKNRHGPTGTVRLYCDIGCASMRDADVDMKGSL